MSPIDPNFGHGNTVPISVSNAVGSANLRLPPLYIQIDLIETGNEDVKLADALTKVLDTMVPVQLESLVGMDSNVSRRLRVVRWLLDAETDLAERVAKMNEESETDAALR